MALRVGELSEDRMGDAYLAFTTALQVAPPSPSRLEHRRGSWFADHAVVAYDEDRIVGHVGCLAFETVVPGGALVPTGGLSRVGVLPTHRRRGLLTEMMTRSLQASHERGEVLGSLRAAEAAIYGRFGYGLAGLSAAVRIKTSRSAFVRPFDVAGSFELLQGPELIQAAKLAYERCLTRPGMLRRADWYWSIFYEEHAEPRPHVADWGVVHRDAKGRPDGFVRWEATDRDSWETKGARISVTELFGASTAVETALWRFVLDLDLVEIVEAEGRPLDEPLRYLLADARAYETTAVWDEQWVRLIDVQAALTARTYGGDEHVVVDVVGDTVLRHNLGRYEIGNAGVRRVRRAADLVVPVDVLGAVYLGGTPWRSLTAAGAIREERRGAVARADRLFASVTTPWCGTFF